MSAPVRVIVNGRPQWRFPDGTLIPVVSGGDGSGDGGDGDGNNSGGDGSGDGADGGDGSGDGADGGDGSGDGDGGDGDGGDGEGDSKAGPKLKSALKKERKARRDADKQVKHLEKEIEALKAKLGGSGDGDGGDGGEGGSDGPSEADLEAARAEGQEALKQAQEKLAAAAVMSQSAGKFNVSGEVVANLIDLEDVLDADGNVDSEAVDDAIAELLENEPALAAEQKPKVTGDGEGGGRGGGGSPDLEKMSMVDYAAHRAKSGDTDDF